LITRKNLDEFKKPLVLIDSVDGWLVRPAPLACLPINMNGKEEEFETAIQFRNEQGDWPEIKWFFREK
jgi:hypothetical protein